jgi:hypothetical protein
MSSPPSPPKPRIPDAVKLREYLEKTVPRSLAEGMADSIAKQVSDGADIGVVLSTAQARLREFGSWLAGPDCVIGAPGAPASREDGKAEREAFIREVLSRSCGFVLSKWPKSQDDYHIVEKHTGRSAEREIVFSLGQDHFKYGIREHCRHYRENEMSSHVPAVEVVVLSATKKGFAILGFASECYDEDRIRNLDKFGRAYSNTVTWLMPVKTAQEIMEFILRKDPSILQDLYSRSFPRCGKSNQVRFNGSGMEIETPQGRYPVPRF